MTIVDVATDRIGLHEPFVHVGVFDYAATAGEEVLVNGSSGGSYQRVVAGVLSSSVDTVLTLGRDGTSNDVPYEVRAGLPLVLPFCPDGYAQTPGANVKVQTSAAATLQINLVLRSTAGAHGSNTDRLASTTAEHLGANAYWLSDADTWSTAAVMQAAVSGKRLRVLAMIGQTNGAGLQRIYSGSTSIFQALGPGANAELILPFSPVGWCETNVGEALGFDCNAAFGRVNLLVQEAA